MCPRTRVSTRVRHCRARTRSNGRTARDPPRQQIVMSVEPRQPGRVRVQGMNLTCTYGWQTGLQNTGEAPGSGC